MVLIHYGDDRFRIGDFYPIKNHSFVKPMGGLWASPEDSQFGWKHWCEAEDFHTNRLKDSFRFTLDIKAKILTINSLKDLISLPTENLVDAKGWTRISWGISLDFEKIAKKYDAIHLTCSGQYATRFSSPLSLYGWDCESVLILKPKYIHEL